MAQVAVLPQPSSMMLVESDDESPRGPGVMTGIIFDWDDTLLSSSWLAQNGLKLDCPPDAITPEARSSLNALGTSVVQVLEKARQFGDVTIVTNAETGWVELSAKKFMPVVVPLLSKMRVVSARSTFEAQHPDDPSAWKVQAFRQEVGRAFRECGGETDRNVISLGDSVHERSALHKVTAGMPRTLTKSVKFVERPTVEQLKRQVDLVHSCFEDIVNHKGSLDLMLTIQLLYQG